MIKTGLVSVTFRKLSPEEVIELVAKAGLDGIEWGGDIHVPHGDIVKARDIAEKTKDAGLCVASYGSYYALGCEKDKNLPFEKVLESAIALEAPVIRIWAGRMASANADEAYWDMAISESRRIADMSKKEGIKIAVETIQRLKEIEGVAGVHVMAIAWEEMVPEIVESAGLYPRPTVN